MTAEMLTRYPDRIHPRQIERLTRSTETMSNLVNDILILGKLESSELQVDRQPLNVNELATQALDDVEAFAEQKQIKFARDCQLRA